MLNKSPNTLVNPIQLPGNRIDVKFGRIQDAALFFLIIFFGGLSALLIFSGSGRSINLIIALLLVSILFVVCFLVVRAKRKAVRFFDKDGIKRGDGRHLSWNDFQGIVKRISTNRYGGKGLWRVELKFVGGEEAWIIPQRVKNYAEISGFIDKLPAANLE